MGELTTAECRQAFNPTYSLTKPHPVQTKRCLLFAHKNIKFEIILSNQSGLFVCFRLRFGLGILCNVFQPVANGLTLFSIFGYSSILTDVFNRNDMKFEAIVTSLTIQTFSTNF